MLKRFVLAKAITWQLSGIIMTLLIGRIFTGDWQGAGAMTAVMTAVGLVCYCLHEMLWQRLMSRHAAPVAAER